MKKIITLLSFIFPAFLRIRLLNAIGHQISLKAILKPFSILSAKKLELDDSARIESFAIIVGLTKLKMGKGSTISRLAYISGNKLLTLKSRSFVGSRSILNTSCGDIYLGEYSAIAPRCTLLTHGTFLPITLGYGVKNKGIKIGSRCWIMQNSTLGPGINVGDNSIALPGSSIVKEIPENIVVYDTPMDRKSFPIDFYRKQLSNENIEVLIKEITLGFLNSKLSSKKIKSFKEAENYIMVDAYKQNFKIVFGLPHEDLNNNNLKDKVQECYFWYNINDALMENTKIFILDFVKINKSLAKAPKSIADFSAYSFYNYGLKFI